MTFKTIIAVDELTAKTDWITVSDLPEIMSEDELARFIGVSSSSLRQDRYLKQGIPYVKIGQRVRYLRDDVIAFLLENRVEVETRQHAVIRRIARA